MWKLFRRRKSAPVTMCDERLSHIAFIMDGNGRWAKKRLLPREMGHVEGAKAMRRITEACFNRGIKTVTVYAFSSENWRRPEQEVNAIMRLLSDYVDTAYREREENASFIHFVGDVSVLSEDLRARIARLEDETRHFEKTLNIALNYGGRGEIVHAVNTLIAEGKTSITEDDITASLYTHPSPMPDLIVRTGGEIRTSNFLLWQSAYAEYAFTSTFWPDFDDRELERIITDFYTRNRRYGGLSK